MNMGSPWTQQLWRLVSVILSDGSGGGGELGPTSSDKERAAGGAFLRCEKWTQMLKMIIQVYWSKAHGQLVARLMLLLTGDSG